jgi:hypothetical protein
MSASGCLRCQRLWYAINGRSSEPHSHPCTEQFQHEFSGVARIVSDIVGQNHALGSCGSHHPHRCGRNIVGKAAAIEREPMPPGEVEEHGRATTARIHSPRRRTWLQPPFLKKVSALDAAHSILPIENIVCAAILGQNRSDARHRLMQPTCLLTARAITNASQNRRPDDFKLYFAATATCRDALIGHF